ncbi:competence protein CoiA family protein [Cryobacterium sp. 5B3]|uniref:competence protein CoiA family protein n=1 Tax=Cryobacterium sp. 5B3 TaxID=3048586 RepID=UPI002AB39335|nr:competence protein CoiA family protein [Cryobacterium sp. 5B3]MDY7541830.1 competence protein CoiA family protein [Cryobacterium sp. 5B3]
MQQFRQGERRHLFAAYQDGRPGLFFLEPGAARMERDFTKEHLRCAVASCETPELTTAGPSTRRHSFRHLHAPNLNHSPESEFHIAAKGIIERWAAGQDATVEARLEQDPDGTRQRRADVLVTWPDGSQLAFEPQYSDLSMSNWQERHDWYADHEIPDVWLFGHGGKQLRTSGEGGLVKLSPVQLAAARTRPVLWINPDQELIATIDVTDTKHWDGKEPLRGRLRLIPVGECTLTRAGPEHPEITRCHSQVLALIEQAESPAPVEVPVPANFDWVDTASILANATPVRQQRAWDTGIRQSPPGAPAKTWQRPAAPAATTREKNSCQLAYEWASTWEARDVARMAGQVWLDSDQGHEVIAMIGSAVANTVLPPVLPLPTHLWQSFLYANFVLTCPPGARIDVDAAAAAVLQQFAGQVLPRTCDLDPDLVRREVGYWFQHAAGTLVRRLGPYVFTRK